MHLVTGGSGYFGQIVVQQLLARGEAVRVFDLNDFEGRHRAEVELVRGDIRDAAAVLPLGICAKLQCSVWWHLERLQP